jgi:hypothetical protein
MCKDVYRGAEMETKNIEKLTWWECVDCGAKLYEPELDLRKAACKCGRGAGRWGVRHSENGPQ